MVKVGVTGATGFIAGALVPLLAKARYDLRLIDDRTGPLEVTYRGWPVERRGFESDLGIALLSDCDVILHLAAVSGVMACARDPAGSARVNVLGTAKLVAMCRERLIPIAFASSFAVVGVPQELPVPESALARPTHEYARQKAAGEELVASLGREGRVPTAVVRQSNVYGGYRAGDRYIAKGNVIQLFAQQVREGHLSVNAPGTQRRDFIHIEDVLTHWEAIARFLVRPDALRSPTTFNVASGEALSVLEVAEKVVQQYAARHPTVARPTVEIVPNPRGGVELIEPEFAVSRRETERTLGVGCRYSVDAALPTILGSESDP